MESLVMKNIKKFLTTVTILPLILTSALIPSTAGAYGPSVMYTPPAGAPAPGALYARAMQASNGKMYATFEQYTTGVSVFPIYESTNNGQTWTKVGDVKDTHKGVGMRWEPHLYELPQAIGSMPAGTLLCAGLVLPYDKSFCEIDLYMSTDSGRSWTYVSTVAEGKVATPGNDPVWEPFLLVANNKLICYYSDERDSAYSQKLVHQTTSDGVNWSSVVNDVAISGGQRPGMAVVAPMSNGSYIMTYEIIGTPSGAYYKISSNPESWNASNSGTVFDAKGSNPYCVNMNGTVILSSGGNNSLYTNTNNGTGAWSQISSPIGACYSRDIVPLSNGRLFVIGAGWNGSGLNNVTYADMAGFGSATGGTPGSGGAKNTGGASASGGGSSTGGRSATSSGLGGTLNTGGVATTLASSGGSLSAGGASRGSGGATTGSTMKSTGGSQNTGGMPNTAGTTNDATGGLFASGGVQTTGKNSVGGSPSNGGTRAATPSGQAGASPATGGAGQDPSKTSSGAAAVSQATNPDGCGCRVHGRDSNGFAAWSLAFFTLSVLRRRRAPWAFGPRPRNANN